MSHQDKSHELESFREKLQEQLRAEFFDKIANDEDPFAERHELISVLSTGLERLVEVEKSFVLQTLKDAEQDDGICPSCLMSNTIDLTNARLLAKIFNNYLEESDSAGH